MDFRVITKAGLTQREFGKLLGVSRVTANRWIHGYEPHYLMQERVVDMLARIEEAVEANKLPLSVAYDRENRYEAIREALNLDSSDG